MKCRVCKAWFRDNSKWDRIRAHSKGWFISKDEKVAYCPNHLPKWVQEWRAANSRFP